MMKSRTRRTEELRQKWVSGISHHLLVWPFFETLAHFLMLEVVRKAPFLSFPRLSIGRRGGKRKKNTPRVKTPGVPEKAESPCCPFAHQAVTPDTEFVPN